MAWTDPHTSNLLGHAASLVTDAYTTRRERDWQRAHAQHYLLARQRQPERADEIDAVYHAGLLTGSGFRRVHTGSTNEPPLYARIDTQQGRSVERAVKRLRRQATLKRTRRRRSRAMTAVEADVLLYLVSLAQTYDHVTPSYDTIARGTGAGRRSVARAIQSLAEANRLEVKTHWKSVPGPFQSAAQQTSNSYRILVEQIEQESPEKSAPADECQLGTVKTP